MTDVPLNARKPLREWREAFLKALAEEGTVSAACRNAGISRNHAYRTRQQDEGFALAWADVESTVTDKLERKAVELALDGEVKLLEFLLKARRPDVYRESVRVQSDVKISHGAALVTDPKLAEDSRGLLRRAAGAGGDVAGGPGGGDQ